MSLGAHLVELRKRFARAAIAIILGAIVGWFLAVVVIAGIREPLLAAAEAQRHVIQLNFDSATGAFDLKTQIAGVVGLLISSPVCLWQVWAFVPALARKELKHAFGFFFSAVPLFLAGCAAGWYVIPRVVILLQSFVGIVSAQAIRRSWRIAIIAIVLFSAIATPSVDIVSMFVLAVPMAGLYLAAVAIATVHDARAAKLAAQLETQYAKELS